VGTCHGFNLGPINKDPDGLPKRWGLGSNSTWIWSNTRIHPTLDFVTWGIHPTREYATKKEISHNKIHGFRTNKADNVNFTTGIIHCLLPSIQKTMEIYVCFSWTWHSWWTQWNLNFLIDPAGSVLIVGAGGLGCPVALYLAAAGGDRSAGRGTRWVLSQKWGGFTMINQHNCWLLYIIVHICLYVYKYIIHVLDFHIM